MVVILLYDVRNPHAEMLLVKVWRQTVGPVVVEGGDVEVEKEPVDV